MTTAIDVIGGVYGERCGFPDWNEIYGSAGRAAVALSAHLANVRLHTILPQKMADQARPIFGSFGVQLLARAGKQFIGFDYLHCLAEPAIHPTPALIEQQPPLRVTADVAVVFGMMESTPQVSADFCVYDPQSPSDPKGFKASGGQTKRLAIVLNSGELRKLAKADGVQGAMKLLKNEGAEVVVIKEGLQGATIIGPNGKVGSVPAYKTGSVFTIGSGDVFVAAFGLAWAVRGMPPAEAAEYASKAVAKYVETSTLPMISPDDAKADPRKPITLKGGSVYLAGPFRELGQRVIINEARTIIPQLGMSVFSPVHDIGHGPAEKVVRKDLKAIEDHDAVFAILNGSSPGTLFEVGYAVRGGKPVFCVAQNMRSVDLKLPSGSGCVIHPDFVSALHLMAWRE